MCVGIPGQIIAILDEAQHLASVDFAGTRRAINIRCILDPPNTAPDCIGDWVLVHVGFAIHRINENEARRTLALLEEMEAGAMEGTPLAAGKTP